MGLYRDPETGLVFETDDTWARANGYTPVSAGEEESKLAAEGIANRGNERGVIGDVNAAATGVASGLTLGASDALLGAALDDDAREQVLAEINKHPIERGVGELVGGLAPAFAAPGSTLARTPAGYLASIGTRVTEAGLERGGVAGTATALAAMGGEGAIANAGAYLGHTALENKAVTAEGLQGALGAGFEFGTVGGGVALGITNGTMAARRMFSRVMDKGAEQVAESAWSTASQAALDADAATADVARQRLDEIRSMKEEALRARQDAKATVREEQIRAQAAGPQQPFKPEPSPPMTTPGGTQVIPGVRGASRIDEAPGLPVDAGHSGETSVSQTSSAIPEPSGPRTEVIPGMKRGGGESVTPDFTSEPPGIQPPTEMEALGRGEAEARRLTATPVTETQQRSGILGMLDELEAYQASEKPLSHSTSIEDLKLQPRNKVPFGNLRTHLGGKLGGERMPLGAADVTDEMVTSVSAKAIADHGYESLSKAGSDAVKLEKARKAIREGQREPIVIAVSPKGRYSIVDGTNRLVAAIEEGKSIKVKWYRGSAALDEGVSTSALRSRMVQSLPEARSATTTELLGKDIAEEESKLLEALHEFQAAKNEFVEKIIANDTAKIQPKVPRDFAMPSITRQGVAPEEIIDLQRGTQTYANRQKTLELLDDAHEAALDRVRGAETAAERGIAIRQADHLEQLLEKLAPPSPQRDIVPGDFLRGVGRDAKVIDRYEQATKKLTEAVGDAAHPASVEHAKAYDAANDEAVRKATDRTMRAVEDHETFGPFQYVGPEYKTPRERVVYAKERSLDADKAYTAIANEERSAQKSYDEIHLKVKQGEKAKKLALREDAKAARASAKAQANVGLLTGIGGALEIANIPGLPKASDLPVVGPLLGAWLKYRAVKAALGRVGGRVPALADSRVAALAARTKDRIAMSVDRSLGFGTKAAIAARKTVPLAAGVISQRIYDDGLPSPPKAAGIQEHVAARVRELSAYVNTPNAIENDVRRQLLGVTDPDVIAAVEKQRRVMMEYLLSKAPKAPQYGALQRVKWLPAPAQAMSFARTYEAVNDPAGMYERIAATQAQVSLEAAEALREVYPQLFTMAQQRLLERARDLKTSVPTQQRIRLSLVYKLPLDVGLDPDNLKITQSVYDRPPPTPAPAMAPAGGPPAPSIAQPTNLVPMYQPTTDRQR